jgi:hypothetical protein
MGRKAVKIVEENIVEDITEGETTTTRNTNRRVMTVMSMRGVLQEVITKGLVTGLNRIRNMRKNKKPEKTKTE